MDGSSEFLTALAHPIRWQVIQSLAVQDLRVGELSELVKRPVNLVSYHLRELKEAGLLQEHRSQADGRDVYYHLDLGKLENGYRRLGKELHPTLGSAKAAVERDLATDKPLRVLFLCTHNSARSQMAEALLRARLGQRVVVASAGTEPSSVHPLALREMAARGIDLAAQTSKHYQQFQGEEFDLVITVCDRAREECPAFSGARRQLHWSLADPARVRGTKEEKARAFAETAAALEQRIEALIQALIG